MLRKANQKTNNKKIDESDFGTQSLHDNKKPPYQTSAPITINNTPSRNFEPRKQQQMYVPKPNSGKNSPASNEPPQSILRITSGEIKPKVSSRLSFKVEDQTQPSSKPKFAKDSRSKTLDSLPITETKEVKDIQSMESVLSAPPTNSEIVTKRNRSKSLNTGPKRLEKSLSSPVSSSPNNHGKKEQNSPIPDRFHGPYKQNSEQLLYAITETPTFDKFVEKFQEMQKNQPEMIPLPDEVRDLGGVFIDDQPNEVTYFFRESKDIKEKFAGPFLAGFFKNEKNMELMENYVLKKAGNCQFPGKASVPTIAFHYLKYKGRPIIPVSLSANNDIDPIRDAVNNHIEQINSANKDIKDAPLYVLVSGHTLNYSTLIAKVKQILKNSKFVPSLITCQEKASGSFFLKMNLKDKNFQVYSSFNCDLFAFDRRKNYGKQSNATSKEVEFHIVPNRRRSIVDLDENFYVTGKPCCTACTDDKSATMIVNVCAKELTKEGANLSTSPIENSIYTESMRNHPIFKSNSYNPPMSKGNSKDEFDVVDNNHSKKERNNSII